MQPLASQPVTNLQPAKKNYHEPHNNYRIISGKLSLLHKEPDGDSVAFLADNPELFQDLYRGYLLKPSTVDKTVQLRFEGIDSPELHYGSAFQPLGAEARNFLLSSILKFRKVTYSKNPNPQKPDTKVIGSDPASIKVQIASNALEPHGRPISYIFLGAPFIEGSLMKLTTAMVEKTVNFQMIKSGFAYLLAYDSMPQEHFDLLKKAANTARSQHKGVWKTDTTFNFKLDDLSSVEGKKAQLIFPKLFRRCVDYFREVSKGFQGELKDWLVSKNQENDMVRISANTTVPFSSLINQVNDNISLQADTNDIIFLGK